MSLNTLSANEVKNRFGTVLREISQTGGPIVVERDGEAVAVILSVSEYSRLQPPPPATGDRLDLVRASFGLWSDRSDIDDDWLADGRSRWQSSWANG